MTTLINTTIGDYTITGFLGKGGMGEVYQAIHNRLGRNVAVKVLTHASGVFDSRFLNEARIQATLQHKNIATLYEFVEHNGLPCIIMELVDGQTLDDYIRASGRLPVTTILTIFQEIVEAIAYIHTKGIVHRDIKSNNIKLTREGAVKLLDFGIAKAGTTPKFTETGGVIGTWEYMAPEQLRGVAANPRTDVWALGVLLYEMITRRLPFESEHFAELYEKLNNAAYLSPSTLHGGVTGELEAIVARCLNKNAEARYADANELLQAIKAQVMYSAVQTEGAKIKPTREASAAALRFKRPPMLVLVSLLLLCGGSYYAYDYLYPPDEQITKTPEIIGTEAGGNQTVAPVSPHTQTSSPEFSGTKEKSDVVTKDSRPLQTGREQPPVTQPGENNISKPPAGSLTLDQPTQRTNQNATTTPTPPPASTLIDPQLVGRWEFTAVDRQGVRMRFLNNISAAGTQELTSLIQDSGRVKAGLGGWQMSSNTGVVSQGTYNATPNTLLWTGPLGPATWRRAGGQPSPSTEVDAAVVGSWSTSFVKDNLNWSGRFEISASGAYKVTFTTTDHLNFRAHAGRWSWTSTKTGVSMQGTYAVSGANSITVTTTNPPLGTANWRRIN